MGFVLHIQTVAAHPSEHAAWVQPWGGQGRALPLLGCGCMVAPETPITEASSKEAASKAVPSGFPMLHGSSSASSQNPKLVLLY